MGEGLKGELIELGELVIQRGSTSNDSRSLLAGPWELDMDQQYTADIEYDPENPDMPPWQLSSDGGDNYAWLIKKVTIADEISPVSTAGWFRNCTELTTVESSGNLDTSRVTDMSYMFEAAFLDTLDVSQWDTSSVTNMSHMFSKCMGLQRLDVSGWDTSRVTNMGGMFISCVKLTTLNVSGWNTSNVADMNAMFDSCVGLRALDVSNWDTSQVTDMSYMFGWCENLHAIYASDSFVTQTVESSDGMFYDCKNLTGGAGTVYNENFMNAEYARIDGGPDSDSPGYFTSRQNA